jgi:hypothetical protein
MKTGPGRDLFARHATGGGKSPDMGRKDTGYIIPYGEPAGIRKIRMPAGNGRSEESRRSMDIISEIIGHVEKRRL